MGTVFAIYKKAPKVSYELGKPRLGFVDEPPVGWYAAMAEVQKRQSSFFKRVKLGQATLKDTEFNRNYADSMALTDPGFTAMWSIMDNPNYAVFKISRWDRDTLADKLYRGSQNIASRDIALVVADDLLRWAGDDDVVLLPEEEFEEIKHLGFTARGYRETGSIWQAMKGKHDD